MSGARFVTPPNRLAEIMRKPGGVAVADAISRAERNLEAIRPACRADMMGLLDAAPWFACAFSGALLAAVPRDPFQVAVFQLSGGTTGIPTVQWNPRGSLGPIYRLNTWSDPDILGKNWGVKEEVTTGYVKADLDAQLGSVGLRGNVGVRAAETRAASMTARVCTASHGSTGIAACGSSLAMKVRIRPAARPITRCVTASSRRCVRLAMRRRSRPAVPAMSGAIARMSRTSWLVSMAKARGLWLRWPRTTIRWPPAPGPRTTGSGSPRFSRSPDC